MVLDNSVITVAHISEFQFCLFVLFLIYYAVPFHFLALFSKANKKQSVNCEFQNERKLISTYIDT